MTLEEIDKLSIKEEEEKEAIVPSSPIDEGYGSYEMEMPSPNKSGTTGGGHGGELKRPDLKGSFRCSICSKVFCHSSSLSRHRMQAHFKSFKCTVCRKDVPNSDSLRTHMYKVHHISRMFMCRCCNWAFPDKSLLHVHLQSNNHSNEQSVITHSVINRSSCQTNRNDPFQLIRSPLLSTLPTVVPDLPVPTLPETCSWLAGLPKPIPTTTPLFLPEKKEEEKYTSQSPTCSSVSFKSDVSAFHQLSSDRTLIASPVDSVSPSGCSTSSRNSDCFDCQITKTRLTITENKSKYMENRVNSLQQESFESKAQINGLEQTVIRMRMEAHVLREHNELFQRKLLECQNLAVRFIQSEKLGDVVEVNSFLRNLINNTILINSQ